MSDEYFDQNRPELPEDLRLENEILKLKLQAETGAFIQASGDFPPEIEYQFLQNVIAYERAAASAPIVKLYDFIGRPDFIKWDEMRNQDDVCPELERIRAIMFENGLHLDVLGRYDDSVIYRFITEELFEMETADVHVPGMLFHFTYEEFHPDHNQELEGRTKDFLENWFDRKIDESSWNHGHPFVVTQAAGLTREEAIAQVKAFFESFANFNNGSFDSGVSFDWNELERTGTGESKGQLRYDAALKSGELVHFEGYYRLYFIYSNGWWYITNFDIPGFTWKAA